MQRGNNGAKHGPCSSHEKFQRITRFTFMRCVDTGIEIERSYTTVA